MSYDVRPMETQDISQVVDIDREAFPGEWPPTNFQYELKNQIARYVVACENGKTIDLPVSSGFLGWLKRLFSSTHPVTTLTRPYIVGFAGMWTMVDEAHITNIAVRPSHRRQGIGKLLLASIIDMAEKANASLVTLEVRASNTVAQNLYTKSGFKQVGVRRGYYTNNREDAILMSIERT